MIDRTRLAETFTKLARINSVSKKEAEICSELKKCFEELGAEIFVDDAAEKINGETGNLVAKFSGTVAKAPILLNGHMDTVECKGTVNVKFDGETFTSDGTTILGGDDKSAVAIILEVMRVVKENGLPHCPIEILLTVSEELGLMGAKHLNHELITATMGYSLDARDPDGIITGAPAADRMTFEIIGKDAHAGSDPEKGINAIWVASRAISSLDPGRIDHESTCNIGVIRGGVETNIVPERVVVRAEARSHDESKLDRITANMAAAFENAVQSYPATEAGAFPRLEKTIVRDFSVLRIPEDHLAVTLAMNAAHRLGRNIEAKRSGGGSDANVFFKKGIVTPVLGTGMTDVHSVRESIKLSDMVKTAELILEIINLHSNE